MLVLVHGLLCGSDCWSGLIARLRPRSDCLALDLPGMGAAPLSGGDMSLTALAGWLRGEILTRREPVTLVASSWGGAIALALACDQPPMNLRGMALFAPVHPFWRASLRQRLLLRPAVARIAAGVLAHSRAVGLHFFLEPMYGDPAHLSAERLQSYRRRLCQPGLGTAVGAYGRHWEADQRQLRGRLSHVQLPVQLLWGDRDRAVPLATAEALRRRLAGAQLTILAGCGHLPFEEQPERCAAALEPFLVSTGSET